MLARSLTLMPDEARVGGMSVALLGTCTGVAATGEGLGVIAISIC